MDAHTDIGRWDEYRELNRSLAVPITVLRDGKEKEVMACPSGLFMETWNERYPDEVWAVYIRPARENGVKPLGMTPMFVVLLDPRPRFTAESLFELHQGTYEEMQVVLSTQRVANIAISKQNA
tara:strand:+ start:648 stop:1016 length:369 start_codon:yes stop_codon:yes gene_type:complete